MNILLVSANTERINMPTMPLGLGLVAASTRRAGHRVHFLDLMFQPDPLLALRDAIGSSAPEVIGISVRNIDDQNRQAPRFLLEQVRPIVDECRRRSGARVVLGGAGFSMFPVSALALLGADYGIQGPGEIPFARLLEHLERGQDPSPIAGVVAAGRGSGIAPSFDEDLAALPLADDELWASADPTSPELWVPIEARRGCPNRCAYCATAQIQGKTIRTRAPRAVVECMGRLAAAGFRQQYFVDNSFNIPESYALELCHAIQAADLGVRWRCILYPHRVSEQLVSAMAAAGCVEVSVGFESGSDPILRVLNKHFRAEDVRRLVAMLARYRIRRVGFLLFGAPGETRETVEESLAFAESLDLDALRTTVGIRVYPNTPLAETAREQGIISRDDDLLRPTFYLAPGLEPWIHERVQAGYRRA